MPWLAGSVWWQVIVAAATVAIAAVAAGCSGPPPANTGPFGGAGNSGLDCVPISHAGLFFTQGLDDVNDNWRGTVAVISKISLVRPRGLRLLRVYAVRLGDQPAYGDMPGLPRIHPDGFTYPAWKHHADAIGARVPYSKDSDRQTNLLLVLKVSARKSTDQGISVWYRVGSQQYHLRTRFGLELVARPARC